MPGLGKPGPIPYNPIIPAAAIAAPITHPTTVTLDPENANTADPPVPPSDAPEAQEERGFMEDWLRDLQVGAAFWSWLPTGLTGQSKRGDLGRSRYLFPLVGLLIGLVPAFVLALAVWLHLGAAAAVLAVFALLVVTGGRAEIAFASVVEALGRSRQREVRANVLSVPRPGYYGVAAVFMLLLLKVALLGGAGGWWDGVCLLLAATAGSRGAVAVISWFADSVDGDRCGGLELEAGRELVWVAAIVTPLLLILFLWFWSGLIAIPVVFAATALAFVWLRGAFGGLPVYGVGAIQQVAEVTILAAGIAYF